MIDDRGKAPSTETKVTSKKPKRKSRYEKVITRVRLE
jgi:hypothetical protein